MKSPFLCLLLGVSAQVRALGTGEKFKLVNGGKAFDRFITIWLENQVCASLQLDLAVVCIGSIHADGGLLLQDYAKVIIDPHFADLKREGISLTKYYAHTHPSQPNYLASIAGDYFGLNHDQSVYIPENVSTVVDLLDTKGISWGGYFEDQPGPGFMGVASKGSSGTEKWDYVRKHKYVVSFIEWLRVEVMHWHDLCRAVDGCP